LAFSAWLLLTAKKENKEKLNHQHFDNGVKKQVSTKLYK